MKNIKLAVLTVALLASSIAMAQDKSALVKQLLDVQRPAVEGMARQPEAAGRIQTAALILAALVEGAALFGAVIGFQIAGKITF